MGNSKIVNVLVFYGTKKSYCTRAISLGGFRTQLSLRIKYNCLQVTFGSVNRLHLGLR